MCSNPLLQLPFLLEWMWAGMGRYIQKSHFREMDKDIGLDLAVSDPPRKVFSGLRTEARNLQVQQ